MSHTVLEGRRITCKTNAKTVHAMRGTVIPPPFYIENFLRFQVQGSTTASLINMYGLVHRQTKDKNMK